MSENSLLIFDVNETLLDMTPLANRVNALLKNDNGFSIWFPSLLHHSLVETVSNSYHDFSEIARGTLSMTAKMMSIEFSPEEIQSTLSVITELPPHPDVLPGLNEMKKHGHTLVALTNGNSSVVMKQMKFAGLTEYFEEIYSVEAVRKYKPSGAPYRYVLEQQDITPEKGLMVAAHGWDISGAQRLGMQTAFIKRTGKSLYPLADKPTYSCVDCLELAEKLSQV